MSILPFAIQSPTPTTHARAAPLPTVRQNAQTTTTQHVLDDGAPRSSLVLARTKRRDFSGAFQLLADFSSSGWIPDEFALGGLLKASSSLSDASLGRQLHAKSIRAGLASERGVRTSLIAMYSTCARLEEARQVFDEIPSANEADVPTWNSIIFAYASRGLYTECFILFSEMLRIARLTATDATYATIASACSAGKLTRIGRMLHAMILKDRICDQIKMHNSLITMYGKWGHLGDAEKVFDAMGLRDVVSWNAMISVQEQSGRFEEALAMFRRLNCVEERVSANRITFLSVLSAIAAVLELKLGKETHACLIKLGLDDDTSIGNSLITMYGKCSEMLKAELLFERLPSCDIISWNTMLSGYAQIHQFESCYELFKKMQPSGLQPDLQTLTVLLCGLSSSSSRLLPSIRLGREIHGYVLRRGGAKEQHVSLCNALILMYSKGDRLADAAKVFRQMMQPNSYTWNAMIDGYSMNDCCIDAIKLFLDMLEEGFEPDNLTFSIVITVCCKLLSIELGRQLHALAMKQCLHAAAGRPFLVSISNSLISMYSKCGSIEDAATVFQRIPKKDIFSWTAMITGYAHHGLAHESVRLFEKMRSSGMQPNSVTYLGLLSACAHAGLSKEGVYYFNLMKRESKAELSFEHYACMVDLFARSGQLSKAEAVALNAISQLDLEGDSCLWLWKVMLGACHAQKKLELGIRMATRILELDPEDETAHVMLSNLYAASGQWEEAALVRRLMSDKGLKKEAGCSWVEIRKRKHVFVAGDNFHENRKEIYEKLDELCTRCRSIGYEPLTGQVLHDVSEAQKGVILSCHSEKLAVSFALLLLLHDGKKKGRGVIRVFKNLRVCRDCHNWIKFVSELEGHEIILRDSRRFHSFKNGKCSCGDYW